MSIHEKRLHSLRYLWRLVVYSFNTWLLLCTVGIIGWCRNLSDAGKIGELLTRITSTTQIIMFDSSIVSWLNLAIVVCIFLMLSMLRSLGRFVGYDIEHRIRDERMLSALGYRTGSIVRYESAYFLLDFFCAWVIASIAMAIFCLCLRSNAVVQIFLDVMGINYFVRVRDAVLIGVVLLFTGWLSVAGRVRKQIRGTI